MTTLKQLCAQVQPGETRRFHGHDTCTGSSKAVVVTNNEAYCFRCGARHKHKSEYSKLATKKREHAAKKHEVCEKMQDAELEYNPHKWPIWAKVWVSRAQLDLYDVDEHIAYWPEQDALVLFAENGVQIRYQHKQFITCGNKIYTYISNTNNVLYITEDILSAIHLSKLGHSIALYGTVLHSNVLDHIMSISSIDTIIIALDNDNPVVRKQQRKLLITLLELGYKTCVLRLDKDPKYIPIHVIERELSSQCHV